MKEKHIAAILVSVLGIGYLVLPILVRTSPSYWLRLDITVIEKQAQNKVTFGVSIRNTSPWPIAFRETTMVVYLNYQLYPVKSVKADLSNPPISREFVILPFGTTYGECWVWLYSFGPSVDVIQGIEVRILGEAGILSIRWQGFSIEKTTQII